MINPELVAYVKQQLAQNVGRDAIKTNLVTGGSWSSADVDEAFASLGDNAPGSVAVPIKKTSHVRLFSIVGILALLIAGGVYVYLQRQAATDLLGDVLGDKASRAVAQSAVFDDADLELSVARIPDATNSLSVFNGIKQNAILKVDQDFLNKYLRTYSSKDMPPVAESAKVLAAYPDLLSLFDAQANKPYQCLFNLGDSCLLNEVRGVANLGALRALVLFQQGKIDAAKDSATKVVSLGQGMTAHANSPVTLLVGWSMQNLGYSILETIGSKGAMSLDVRAKLIENLRTEQRNVLRYVYTDTAEEVDYITSPENKPSRSLGPDEEDVINTYREGAAASPSAWNPVETKRYFYDSYKTMLSNVDLACGATSTESGIDLKFDPNDTKVENYVGKTLYTTAYASFDSLNAKRCAIESLIQGPVDNNAPILIQDTRLSTTTISGELKNGIRSFEEDVNRVKMVHRMLASVSFAVYKDKNECQKAIIGTIESDATSIRNNIQPAVDLINALVPKYRELSAYFDKGGEMTQEKIGLYNGLSTDLKLADGYVDKVLSPAETFVSAPRMDKVLQQLNSCN
jgi:hypothetical protein